MNGLTTTVIGNLTADPEHRPQQNGGQSWTRLRIASTPRTYDRNTGQYTDGETMYISAIAYAQLADNVARSLYKGDRVICHGVLTQKTYTDRNNTERQGLNLKIEAIGPEIRFTPATSTHREHSTPANAPAPQQTAQTQQSSWKQQGTDNAPWGQAPDQQPAFDDKPF